MAQANKVTPPAGNGPTSYFQRLSTDYSRQTGDSTFNLIHKFLQQFPHEITPTTKVHDNACGVGTASFALLSCVPQSSHPNSIDATDNSEGMLTALRDTIQRRGIADIISAHAMDSTSLTFPDNHFDMSITNISITNFSDPAKALSEIFRTLKPDHLAIISIWKRFTAAEIIHKAQRNIKPDAVLMKMPKAEFTQQGYLRDRVREAGFNKVDEHLVDTLVQGDAIQGLRGFMLGPFTRSAREGWTEYEVNQWPGAVDEIIEDEVSRNGGIHMSAWFITALK